MNRLFTLICLIICSLSAQRGYSQALTFESLNFDFGTIAEDGGKVTHTFKYKSSGTKPSIIIAAVSSCGCTTPIYSKQPIAPGAWSTIEVTYDPMDRPGKFSKTIQVVIAPHNKKYVLTITGDVTPREKSVEEIYPFDMGGGVRIGGNYYPLSLIEQGERLEVSVPYINTSKRSATIEIRPELKSGILEYDLPKSIAAGEKGNITLAYDMSKHPNYYGVINDKYKVDINGKESRYKLMVNAHAVDKFTKEQRERAAIMNLSTRIIKLGEVRKGSKSSKQSLTIENSGISDLVVRDIHLGEGVYCSLTPGSKIKEGSTRKIEVWASGKEISLGNFSRYITFTLNDPDAPMVRVRVIGTVVK